MVEYRASAIYTVICIDLEVKSKIHKIQDSQKSNTPVDKLKENLSTRG